LVPKTGSWALGFDDENRLTSVTYPAGEGSQTDGYEYNALGQRMRWIRNGYTTRYVYCGERVLEENSYAGTVLAWHTPSSGSYYTPWLHMQRWNTGHSYPLYNGIGTVRGLVDGDGVRTDSYSMDVFGVDLGSSGSTRAPYKFGGAWGYLTDSSGLLQLGARFYWPELGRFVQQDPIGDGVNWYAYVGNNPVRWVDPEGRSAQEVWETVKALGSYEGSWRAVFSPRCTGSAAYYKAYIRGMTGWESGITNVPTAYSYRGAGPLWSARTYYTLTDARFTNWGRASKVLVPRLAGKITPWAARANAVSIAAIYPLSLYYGGRAADDLVWYR